MTERQDEDERRVDLQVDKNSFAVSTLIYASSVFAADHSPQFLLLASVCLPCPHALAHGAAVLQGLESFGGGDANVSLGPGGEDRLGDGGEYVPGRERVRVGVKEKEG